MKMMNRTKIICVFFLFVLFTQITGSVIAAESTAEKNYWDSYTGVVEQVSVRIKNQFPAHIKSELGAPSLVEFKPRSSQRIDNETVMYTADLVVDISFNLATDLAVDRLPISQSQVTERWGIIHTCTDFGRSKTFTFEGVSYDLNKRLGFSGTFRERVVKTNTYDISMPTRSLSVDPTQYGVRQPLEFEINVAEPPLNYDFGGKSVDFKTKAFISSVYNVQIVESSSRALPEYNNIWQSEVKTEIYAVAPNIGGAAQSFFSNTISSYSPGVRFTKYEDKSLIQGQWAPISKGSALTKINNNTFQTRAPDLIPNLVEYRQFYKTKLLEAAVDTETDTLKISPARVTVLSTVEPVVEKYRVLGYKIQNYAQQYTLRIKIELNSLCEVKITQTTPHTPLNNITVERADYYWDNYATGATEAQIFAQRSQLLGNLELFGAELALWAKQNWWVIALIVILAIGGVAIYLRGFVPQPAPAPAGGGKPQTKKIEFFTFKSYGPRTHTRPRRRKTRKQKR